MLQVEATGNKYVPYTSTCVVSEFYFEETGQEIATRFKGMFSALN
jgi:hypothetical protein